MVYQYDFLFITYYWKISFLFVGYLCDRLQKTLFKQISEEKKMEENSCHMAQQSSPDPSNLSLWEPVYLLGSVNLSTAPGVLELFTAEVNPGFPQDNIMDFISPTSIPLVLLKSSKKVVYSDSVSFGNFNFLKHIAVSVDVIFLPSITFACLIHLSLWLSLIVRPSESLSPNLANSWNCFEKLLLSTIFSTAGCSWILNIFPTFA